LDCQGECLGAVGAALGMIGSGPVQEAFCSCLFFVFFKYCFFLLSSFKSVEQDDFGEWTKEYFNTEIVPFILAVEKRQKLDLYDGHKSKLVYLTKHRDFFKD